jgi:hypothetical protein
MICLLDVGPFKVESGVEKGCLLLLHCQGAPARPALKRYVSSAFCAGWIAGNSTLVLVSRVMVELFNAVPAWLYCANESGATVPILPFAGAYKRSAVAKMI